MMAPPRAAVLLALALASFATLVQLPLAALAQYPVKPIRVVVPFPGGGGPANMAGRIVQLMGTALGQPIIVDNRPGAEGAIGADIVLKSTPDGHTLFVGTNTAMSALPHLRKVPPYDPLTAFAPVGLVGRFTFFLIAHPSLPAKTVAELLEYARANSGRLSYASGNSGGIVMMAQFATANRLDMVHVPYKGDVAAINDFGAGRVQLMFASTTFLSLIREGRLRALAVVLPNRTPLLPEVPTLAEAGANAVTVEIWGGLFAPARTPKPVVERLNRELNAVLQSAEGRDLLEREGIMAQVSSTGEFAAHVRRQYEIWGQAIRAAGIPQE